MNKLQKWLALALCVSMMAGVAAFAEGTAIEPVATEEAAATVVAVEAELADDALLATVNGEEVKWADVKAGYESLVNNYGSYYDMADQANVKLFRAVALENRITEKLLTQQAAANGLDQLTEEEKTATYAKADSDWEAALQSYITNNFPDMTEESTEEEKTTARTAAIAYYNEMGYTPEILREEYLKAEIYGRVEDMVTKDVVVADEDVETAYQAKVAADKAQYENDLAAYVEYNSYVEQMAMYAMMYGNANEMEHAWYKPAGFRAVKHILLSVDEDLMSKYKDLQARLEEQMDAEASAAQGGEAGEAPAVDETALPEATAEAQATENPATPEPTQEPVSQDDVNNAKAEILQSLADKIDEINQKVAEGADFDELIATYAVKEDGTATDPGMTSEPYKTSGYEVASQSTNYVPEFVEAAFSVDQVGDVSAPYLSDYGVHIVKYIADVPAGPVEMTAAEREAKRASLLEEKKSELISSRIEEWRAAAALNYTGVVPSLAELEAAEPETDVEETPVDSGADAPAEDAAPAQEATAQPEATETVTP